MLKRSKSKDCPAVTVTRSPIGSSLLPETNITIPAHGPTPLRNLVARRRGMQCSNPKCRASTSGPQLDSQKALNIGVAAHITAASPGGPRYDSSLSVMNRQSADNGIWLCQNCAKLVDNDPGRYTVVRLRQWKSGAEEAARIAIESRNTEQQASFAAGYCSVEIHGKWDSSKIADLLRAKLFEEEQQEPNPFSELDNCVIDHQILGEYYLPYRTHEAMIVVTAS